MDRSSVPARLLRSGLLAAAALCLGAAGPRVFLGGLLGFADLADPADTQAFRAGGQGGFYLHYSALDPRYAQGKLPQIAAVLGHGQDSMAEIGLFHPGFFRQEWQQAIRAPGFDPKVALVNLPTTHPLPVTPATVTQFTAFVQEGRAAGLAVLAPVIVPNDPAHLPFPFASPHWDGARAAALAGGGIAFDTPAAFYLHGFFSAGQDAAYQRFVADALAWAHQQHLLSVVIVSPYHDGGHFLDDARSLYARIAAGGVLPGAWVVEAYDTGQPPSAVPPIGESSYGTPPGPETNPESLAGVALWFVRNAKTDPSGIPAPHAN